MAAEKPRRELLREFLSLRCLHVVDSVQDDYMVGFYADPFLISAAHGFGPPAEIDWRLMYKDGEAVRRQRPAAGRQARAASKEEAVFEGRDKGGIVRVARGRNCGVEGLEDFRHDHIAGRCMGIYMCVSDASLSAAHLILPTRILPCTRHKSITTAHHGIR